MRSRSYLERRSRFILVEQLKRHKTSKVYIQKQCSIKRKYTLAWSLSMHNSGLCLLVPSHTKFLYQHQFSHFSVKCSAVRRNPALMFFYSSPSPKQTRLKQSSELISMSRRRQAGVVPIRSIRADRESTDRPQGVGEKRRIDHKESEKENRLTGNRGKDGR